MACKHNARAHLAFLAGGILLEITQSSFLITLVVLDEAIGAENTLSKVLQKENLQLSSVPILISSSIAHIKNIGPLSLSFEISCTKWRKDTKKIFGNL